MECKESLIYTGLAWELQLKPSYSKMRPLLDNGTYVDWSRDADDDYYLLFSAHN